MSTREIAIYDETYEAVTDLSTGQYKGVAYVGSSGQINLGGGNNSFGVLQNKPRAQGAAATVRHHGISRMVVDGSGTPIVIGSALTPNSGIGIVGVAGNIAIGTALQASTVNGDVIAVLLTGPFRIHA